MASFRTGELSAVSIFGHRRVCHSVLPKRAYKIVVDGIESHFFHPEIDDDWLLVHQVTDPKRPSLTSFFPTKGTNKKALNNLPDFDCNQSSESLPCLAHTAGIRRGLSHGTLCYT
jgi:hypothetical protein